jgi:DNA-directed RNA polymerase specialized sigma24 family protein
VVVYVLGFEYSTAARILELPTGTVASRLARGKAELRRHLGLATRKECMR